MSFKDVINTYFNLVESKLPNFHKLKNKGTSMEEVEKYEQLVGIDFPEDLKELYTMMNGDNETVFGFVMGLNFYSVEDMFNTWLSWRKYDNDLELNDPQYYSSIVEDTVKCRYTNKGWLPIAHDCGSNYFGIDLDPDKNGTRGQIINFGRDENAKMVFSISLKDFFELNIKLFDKIQVENLEGNRYFITNKYGAHAIDWLKKSP